jgi:hypothetical protein
MNRRMKLPPEPGTAPLKSGHIRLYHQTCAERLPGIKKHGLLLEHARGIEGPCRIYASEQPFYGAAATQPTVEFQWPREDFDAPYWPMTPRDAYGYRAPCAVVPPSAFLAVHEEWHRHARYWEEQPEAIAEILAGQHDDLLDMPGYGEGIRWIKKKYGGRK